LELTLYRDTSGFETLRNEWNDLLRRSRFDTIFLTWEWQSTWWRLLGQRRGPLYLLTAREEGRLIGIIPLYLSGVPGNQTLSVVGCVEVSDYLDMIMEAGQEDAVYTAFARWLDGPDAPAWNCLELCNQPGPSLTHTDFAVIARQMGWLVEVDQEDVCPVVDLPGDFETYLESLDKKQRHEIRRKLRRIERETPDAGFRVVSGGPDLSAAMDSFITLHKLSRSDKDAFMTEDMAAFFHGLAEVLAAAGWLEVSFLDIGDQPAATYFCFNYHNETQVYNSGYDPESYPQLSAGWVLLARVIEYSIAQGRERLDFLQGNEDYKYRFGGVDTPVYHTLIRRYR
jgi:CelD/BcsL family acetyltransferase involved in cellulose biosynthesis